MGHIGNALRGCRTGCLFLDGTSDWGGVCPSWLGSGNSHIWLSEGVPAPVV